VGPAGEQKAIGTGEIETLAANLSLISIGYRGIPLPGIMESFFDNSRGVVRNVRGRVDASRGGGVGGLYVSGWLKRGPSGIIGTNIVDAKDTVASIVADVESGQVCGKERENLKDLLVMRKVKVVDWASWRKIDAYEKAVKRSEDQPRDKITSVSKQLEAAGFSPSSLPK
jgi:NADPH-dependent glutamate synthase beta subunit-like oxidoreductase